MCSTIVRREIQSLIFLSCFGGEGWSLSLPHSCDSISLFSLVLSPWCEHFPLYSFHIILFFQPLHVPVSNPHSFSSLTLAHSLKKAIFSQMVKSFSLKHSRSPATSIWHITWTSLISVTFSPELCSNILLTFYLFLLVSSLFTLWFLLK